MPTDFFTEPLRFFNSLFQEELRLPSFGWASDGYHGFRSTFIVFDAILLAALIGTFLVSLKYRPHLLVKHHAKKETFTLRDALFKDRWSKVLERAAAGSADAMKLAIIDADKLADDMLKQMGLQGEHMADRLEKVSSERLPSVDRLWRAHRLRNDLVHTPGFTLSEAEGKRAMNDYTSFFKSIGLLGGSTQSKTHH
jgi:hypothetical protein